MRNRVKITVMSGTLLSALVLSGCAWQSDLDAANAKNKDLEQQVATLTSQNAAMQAQVTRLQGAIKYTVNSDLLFSSGGWEISSSGQRVIANLAKKLAPTQQNKIVVNGYTDNTKVGPALQQQGVMNNQDLSQKRADSVMQYIITQGVDPSLISAVGHGDQDPVATNDTAQGRAQNRRVELTLGGPVT